MRFIVVKSKCCKRKYVVWDTKLKSEWTGCLSKREAEAQANAIRYCEGEN